MAWNKVEHAELHLFRKWLSGQLPGSLPAWGRDGLGPESRVPRMADVASSITDSGSAAWRWDGQARLGLS